MKAKRYEIDHKGKITPNNFGQNSKFEPTLEPALRFFSKRIFSALFSQNEGQIRFVIVYLHRLVIDQNNTKYWNNFRVEVKRQATFRTLRRYLHWPSGEVFTSSTGK